MSMYIPPEDQHETGVEGAEFVDVDQPDTEDDVERRRASVANARRGGDRPEAGSDAPLDTDPDAGQLPSDTDVQAERQP